MGLEPYRIVKGPVGYNVEGFFNVTYRRNWFEKLFGMPKGLYGWHLLDETGNRWYICDRVSYWKPAIYSTLKKAQEFIDWQKSVGAIVQ